MGVPSSQMVTDDGIAMLLTGPCAGTLKRVKLRGTKVRVDSLSSGHGKSNHPQATGIRMLLSHCLSLEGVRHNSKDVIVALSGFLKEERHRMDGSLLSLAYMDFTSCFTVFSQRLELLPGLTEVASCTHKAHHILTQKPGENRSRCASIFKASVKEAPR